MKILCHNQLTFANIDSKPVIAEFSGGMMTSDSGLLLLREVDRATSLVEQFSRALSDPRDPVKIRHGNVDLLRQRIFAIATGYEDCNDHDTLRFDPALKAAVGLLPGADNALASQSTLSRFENRLSASELRRVSDVLFDAYVEAHPKKRELVVIDMDSTDDPTHGQQQMFFFHGYYDQHMYHPLFAFDGVTGFPLAAVLRPGNAHASKGAVGILKRLIRRLKQAYPKATILFRGDAGFAVPDIYDLLDNEKVLYTIGLITNKLLRKNVECLSRLAELNFAQSEEKQRLFTAFQYRAESWKRSRRVIGKVEKSSDGSNTRFVVTNILLPPPDQLYDDVYVGRCEAENRIKELKLYLKADRLSCSRFKANQFRLLLHTFAFVLLWHLRKNLAGTELATATVETLRLKLLKVGALVKQSVRRVLFIMPKAYPHQSQFATALHNIQNMPLRC